MSLSISTCTAKYGGEILRLKLTRAPVLPEKVGSRSCSRDISCSEGMYIRKICTLRGNVHSKSMHAQRVYMLRGCARSKGTHIRNGYTLRGNVHSEGMHARRVHMLGMYTRSECVHT